MLLGAVIVIGLQSISTKNISLIQSANAAGNNVPCRVISADENDINKLFQSGYRVKGVGAAAGANSSGYPSVQWSTTVVMCKGFLWYLANPRSYEG